MKRKFLLLWLEGMVQSWGHDSKFSYRDTLPFPTKSGVFGLLLAAMGKTGPQKELLKELDEMDFVVHAYSKNGVTPSVTQDYQVVGNGYDKKDKWENLMIPRTRDGKIPNTGGSKLTFRNYIQDGVFAVILELPINLEDEIVSALTIPKLPLYLGRKSCIPSSMIYRGVYDSMAEVNTALTDLEDKGGYRRLFHVIEGRHEDSGDVLVIQDVPISFGTEKEYTSRYVTLIKDENGE